MPHYVIGRMHDSTNETMNYRPGDISGLQIIEDTDAMTAIENNATGPGQYFATEVEVRTVAFKVVD
jgi:hypothetical protein